MRRLLPLLTFPMWASAQEFIVHPEWLVEPAPGTIYANGVGSPAVGYDPNTDTWTMFFETQFGPDEPVGEPCRQGHWGIGRATSSDGLSWTVDPELVIEPAPDTYYSCVVAHPDVIFDGTVWRLWFKAQQTNTICIPGGPVPRWGCSAVTGVGYATSTDGVNFKITPEPVINLFSFGFPAVVKDGGVMRMLLAYSNASNDVYELWESVSIDDGLTWSTPQFVIGPGFADWVEDEIYNPAMVCDPTYTEPFGPFVLYAGGRNVEPQPGGPPAIVTAGLGRAFSTDGVTWAWDGTEAIVSWSLRPDPPTPPDRDWRHWDAMRVGDDTLLFFSQRDDLGHNRVGLAYTFDTVHTRLPERLISNRICDGPMDTGGDPADDSDTETQVDTDAADTDTYNPGSSVIDPKDGAEDGCQCESGGRPPALAWAGLAAWVLLLRRRRA